MKLKKVMAVVIALAMMLSTMSFSAFAETADLTISTVEQLQAFAAEVNAGNSYEGKTVVLANDIDMGWTAVVIGTLSSPFKGTFDGQGNTVKNITIYENGSDNDYFADSDDCIGLFGVINTPAVIKNVTVSDPFIVGNSYIGGIVGMGYTGTIENCHVIGEIDIEGYYMVGGINGHGYATITNCSVIGAEGWDYNFIGATYKEANLEGDNVGGIVGHNGEHNDIIGCEVKNVTVSGTRKVGGIVGIAAQNSDIKDCKVSDLIVETTATAEYAAANAKTMSIGGLVGQYQKNGNNDASISGCEVNGLTFVNVNDVNVSTGALSGGLRGTAGSTVAPSETVTATGNAVSGVVGANTAYLISAAKIGDTEYATFEEAVAASVNGDEIVLLSDVEITVNASYTNNFSNKAVNIDGNGFTMTQADDCVIEYALLHYYEVPSPVTIKNLTIDGIRGGAAIWANEADIILDNCVIKNAQHTQSQGVVRTTGCDATIKNSKFINNDCNMLVSFNYDLDSSEPSVDALKIQNCEFTGNNCNDTAAIYFVKGVSSEITGSTFKGNTIDTTSHAAIAYYSEGANGVVTDNVFENNTIKAGSARAGVLILEAGTTASENAFVSNSISSTNSGTTYVGTVVNKADADSEGIIISSNYWDGGKPDVANVRGAETVLDDYYTTNADGVLGGLVSTAVAVAKIGDTSYTSFDDALTAASAMTGDVVVEIYDRVTLDKALSGSYSTIKFVGKADVAEIYLDVQGYITATGKKVTFEDLKLSKVAGGYVTNAGFMNLAFGVFDVTEVTYKNCTFLNGAYASSGDVTFTGCTFYRSHDRYGLWAYGDVDAVVDSCIFADIRGVKMYAEGGEKTVNLTVKNTDFTAADNKPAIVLTYGESVTLEGNTYSSKGVFELDLDGDPNGTPVTSDVPVTCINDNGACGILVDGKIYTTVAQAAAVATEGSNVVLLHNSTETVEFAEGVNLDKNGFTADGVTVKSNKLARMGDKEYTTVAEALAVAKATGMTDVTITLIGETTKESALELEDAFNLYCVSEFNSVTFNQEDSSKVYYIDTIYTGSRKNGGYFVFDGVNICVISQYIFEGNVKLINNSVVKSVAEANCFIYSGTTTVEAGSKLQGVIEDFRGGDLIVDGGRTDGTYNEIPDVQDSIMHIRWSGDSLNLKNGAFVKVNAVNEVGKINMEAGASINISASKLEAWEYINVVANATINTDVNSFISTNKITGAGKIVIDATNFDGNTVQVIAADMSAFTGTVEVKGDGAYEITSTGINVVAKPVAKIGEASYATLEAAFAAAQNGDTVTLLNDVNLDAKTIVIPAGVKVTLDLNGKTITGTDKNVKGNFYLFDNRGEFTVTGEGKITLVAVTNREWNASSVVIANNPGGKLIIESGNIEHLGGTDMAYAIDNLTNGKGTYAETVINGGTIKSTYRAVRQFLNGTEAQNILTVNGGVVEGENKSIFFHDPSKNANSGTLTVTENATLNGDVYLFVTAESTEWPVEVSIAASAVYGEVVSKNVPTGYKVAESNGSYGVVEFNAVAKIGDAEYATFEEAAAAIKTDGSDTTIKLLQDIELTTSIEFNYGTGNVIFTADEPVTVRQKAVGLDLAFVTAKDMNIIVDENVTFEIYDNASGMYLYYGPSLEVKGTITGGQNWGTLYLFNGSHTITETGKVSVGRIQTGFTDVEVKGEIDTNYLLVEGSTFVADGAIVDAGVIYDNNNGGQRWGASVFDIINSSEVKTTNLTLSYADSVLTIDTTSSITADKIKGAGKIVIDATNFDGNTVQVIAADMSAFTGAVEVKGDADYELTSTGVVVIAKAEPVAKIGEELYEDLQSAINAANGKTVTILEDIDLGDTTVRIPTAVDMILDLNGKTISGVCNGDQASMIIVENTAKLTIKDSGENGKVTYKSGTSKVGFGIDVKGDLVLDSGIIELTGSWNLGFAVDVRPNAWGTAYTAPTSFVMNGGKVISSDTAVRVDSSSSDTYEPLGVTFTMNAGVIESEWDAIFVQHRYANDLYININDGQISGMNSPIRIYGDTVVSDVDINISGGTFKYTGAAGTSGWIVENVLKGKSEVVAEANIAISGGTFDGDVSDYCAEDYEIKANDDGTFGVQEKVEEETVKPFKDNALFIANIENEVIDGVTYHPIYIATSVDSLNYRKVGFDFTFQIFDPETKEVTYTAPAVSTETRNVYSSISDANTRYTVDSIGGKGVYLYMDKILFHSGYYHNDNTKFTVTPYAIDMNGNKITGWTLEMTNEFYRSLQSGNVKVDMFKEVK